MFENLFYNFLGVFNLKLNNNFLNCIYKYYTMK